jgi:hypothetical protein
VRSVTILRLKNQLDIKEHKNVFKGFDFYHKDSCGSFEMIEVFNIVQNRRTIALDTVMKAEDERRSLVNQLIFNS